MSYTTYADITPEQNAAFEAKYGKSRLSELEVAVDDAKYKFLVRKPDRAVLEAIGSHAAKKDVQKINQVLIKNCVLGGDMEALDKDGEVYLAVLDAINLLKSKATSTIKKR